MAEGALGRLGIPVYSAGKYIGFNGIRIAGWDDTTIPMHMPFTKFLGVLLIPT